VKILIIDDNASKSEEIAAALANTLGPDQTYTVTVVSTLSDAVRVLNIVAFELVILDLMLPYVVGVDADSRAGLELLRQLRSHEGINKAATVVALSAFPEEISTFRNRFVELGVILSSFDDDGSWKRLIQQVLQDLKSRAETSIDLDFLVICALEEEREGYNSCVKDLSAAVVSGLNVRYVRLGGERELLGAIIRLSRLGLVAATFETSAALSVFRTKVLCMSGICAGFASESNLGQLVIASPAWEYQAGKWSDDGFEIAPLQVALRPGTRAVIDQVIGRQSFCENLEVGLNPGWARPRLQSKPILAPFATGSAVIADRTRLEHIQKQHRKVAAIDMETYGVYYAANESNKHVEHFFSIKAVVDFADRAKDDDLHHYGSSVSARATLQVIHALLGPG
jgi:adenosylhomocysteine nucleosidase